MSGVFRIKVRFRVALVVLLVGLVVATVAAIGFFSFLNSRAAAQELADQVLAQTSAGIDRQVAALLRQANDSTALVARRIESGQAASNDFPALLALFRDLLAVHPRLTSLFIGRSEHGEAAGVSRLQGGKPSVWQTTWNPQAGGLDLREYPIDQGPSTHPAAGPSGAPGTPSRGPDSRSRPWFAGAREKARPIWTDAYVFLGVEGVHDVLGVTQATPVYGGGADGSSEATDKAPGKTLDAVVMADFDLGELSRFLQRVKVGKTGYAFIVELRPDGSRRVIAHPRPEILVVSAIPAASAAPGTAGGRELSPIDTFADAPARAFLAQVPASVGKDAKDDPSAGSVAAGASAGGSAAAEVGSIRFKADGRKYLGTWRRVQGERRPHWLICALLPEEEVLGYAHRSTRLTFFVTLAALALAVVLAVAVSRQVARPLEYLAREATAVGRLRLEAKPAPPSFVREVDHLAAATEEMKAGLRSFQKYVPADLVRGLLDSGQEARLGGERRAVSIFFSDIADFSTTAETMPGEALVEHLGEYLGAVSDQVEHRGGTVDKFIGDAVMAFWGAPAPDPLHATGACIAAWRTQQKLAKLRPGWEAAGKPPCFTRIAVHTGEVVVGNIGSAARMNYTIVGDAVNAASRLEGLNKYYGTGILVSEQAYQAAQQSIVARPVDWVSVKGRRQGMLVYELLGLRAETDPAMGEFVERAAAALAAYRQRDWVGAIRLFEELQRRRPGDGPAVTMIARCRQYLETPPGEEWDGVYRMTSK